MIITWFLFCFSWHLPLISCTSACKTSIKLQESVMMLKTLYFTVMCLIRTSLSFPSCCFFKNLTLSLLSSFMNPECQEKSWHSGFISYLLALCLCVQHACLSTHSLLTMAWLRCQWNRVRLPEPTAHTSEVKICKSLSDGPLTCKQN